MPACSEQPCPLGSANPCPNAVHMEPFSTSVFKVLIWIFATTTKICTRVRCTQIHTTSFETNPSPSYSSLVNLQWRHSISHTLKRHPFSGLVHSAGELLHTPKRISTSMTTDLLFQWASTLSGIRWRNFLAFWLNARFHPHRQFCLPKMAHLELVFNATVRLGNRDSYLFKVWE